MSSGDEVVTDLNIKADIDVAGDGKICPQGEVFEMKAYTAKDGTTYSYADYTPAKDDRKMLLLSGYMVQVKVERIHTLIF